MGISNKKLERHIAEIDIHKSLGTPHSWVNIPHVELMGQSEIRFYDIRICSICYYAEKRLGRPEREWIELEGYDSLSLLQRYKAYIRQGF